MPPKREDEPSSSRRFEQEMLEDALSAIRGLPNKAVELDRQLTLLGERVEAIKGRIESLERVVDNVEQRLRNRLDRTDQRIDMEVENKRQVSRATLIVVGGLITGFVVTGLGLLAKALGVV